MNPSIIVHGGAYGIPDSLVEANIGGCRMAAETGHGLLVGGASALDAVEAAVALMEDDPTFDAGRGSVLNQAGAVEMDAMVMDGRTLKSGAVAALRHIRNPVKVARKVMEDKDVAFLVGEGALKFALRHGFEECTEEDLLVGRELDDYREFLRSGVLRTREFFTGEKADTVGACAIDAEGHVACATSTGGTPRKMEGRVGDSPLVGSGAYADDAIGAASATGWGEKIMAVVLSKTALDLLKLRFQPLEAAHEAIGVLSARADSLGGLIMVDTKGRTGFHHNTPRMAFAFVEGPTGKNGAGVRCDQVHLE